MTYPSGRSEDGYATAKLVLKGLDHSTEHAELDAAAKDWWPVAGMWTSEESEHHRPLVVVRATTEGDVVKALAEARTRGLVVVARGAGSGVVGGVVGNGGHMSLDLSRMNNVVKIDPDRREVVVEPGKLAGELETELNEIGLTLGHYPQSLYLASVGGLVATRSSGTFSNKYGGIEDLVVGMRVVLANGAISEFRSVPRSATGPHAMPIFVGSEGTLGVISQVTLRLFSVPEARQFGGFTFPTFEEAVLATKECFRRHVVPAVARIYDEIEAKNLYARVGEDLGLPLLIVGHDGVEQIVSAEGQLVRAIAEKFNGKWIGHEIGEAWEGHRFNAQWLTDGNNGPGKMADAIEIAAAWPDIMPIFDEVKETLAKECSQLMAHMSHFYSTGGAIYFIFTIDEDSAEAALERYLKVWDGVLEITLKNGGSISHHHGVGRMRSPYLTREMGTAHNVLEALKRALDPDCLLNPGNLGLKPTAQGESA